MSLIISNLNKISKGKRIVENCSFYINKGEIVGIFGPNGAGKSTSFAMMVGLLKSDAGSMISMDGLEITNMGLSERARNGLAYLPQESSIFENLTVEENLMMVLEIRMMKKDIMKQRIKNLLNEMHLEYLRFAKCKSLSGGERRRVEIARCWAMDPLYMLLDEPTAGLDPISISELCQFIIKLSKSAVGIMITDHNVKYIASIIDRGYVMNRGKIIASGSGIDICSDPLVKEIYLGDHC